jgi:predicted MFS family arabinose efflux permease
VAAALFGVFFFLTLYLQQVLDYDALTTGLAYLPMSASLIVASSVASRLVDRFTPKPVLVSGLLLAAAGLLLLTRILRGRRLRQ